MIAGDELLTDSRHTTGSNGDLSSTLRGNDCPPDADTEDAEEKARLICQVLELQNTLDGKRITLILIPSPNPYPHRNPNPSPNPYPNCNPRLICQVLELQNTLQMVSE